ncbi:MAG: Tsac [Frankiales bacterium]|nr:Tsac [Frankiales bacterium]
MVLASLGSTLYPLDVFGPVEPSTLQGPVRQGLGRYGDGLFIEEGTTNLVPNPSFEAGVTGWGGNNATLGTTSAFAQTGSQCLTATATALPTPGAYYLGIPAAASTTYTISAYVRVSKPGKQIQVGIDFGGGNYAPVTTGTLTPNVWTRVTATATSAAGTTTMAATIYLAGASVAAGDVLNIDAVQIEQKAYATSYCDGSLATAWNAAGNLLPAAAQSFEDGTTGGWINQLQATLSNSSAQFYAGTRSLLATATTAASTCAVGSAVGTAGVAVTPGKTYTASMWVRPGVAQASANTIIRWYTAAGAAASTASVSSNNPAMVANVWQRVSVTAVAPSDAAFAAVQQNFTATNIGDLFYIDAVRLDEGSASGAYRWTGAENASTSTRATTTLQTALPSLSAGAVTVALWLRCGGNFATIGTPALFARLTAVAGSNTEGFALYAQTGGVSVQKVVANTFVNLATGVSFAAGDLALVALTFDGTTLASYVAKNGAAVVSATTTSATTPAALGFAAIGFEPQNGGGQPNSVVEQVVVYNRVLSGTEITALANNQGETTYRDDPNIVLAVGTGLVRGTVRASSSAGTGNYRGRTPVACSIEAITNTPGSPDDDSATYKITVPAGSGIGQGQLVTPNSAAGGNLYTVQKVFSPGGVYDELLVA